MRTLRTHLLLVLVAGVVLLALTYQLQSFRNYQLATAAAYLCATAGLTMLTGLSGQLSLGHGALMATGAYTAAITANAMSNHSIVGGWTLIVSLAAAVVVTALVGLVIGLAAARLRGPYLAGVTLAVAVVVPSITTVFDSKLGGDQGISMYVDPAPGSLGADFPLERWQAWVAVLCALLTLLVLANLGRSGFGRTLRAVRDDEVAAQLSGINVARAQVIAFGVSAATAGLGGGVLAFLTQAVSPGAFSLTLSLYLLMAVVIGGLGSLAGAVYGAVLLVALPELTNSLSDSLSLSTSTAQRLQGNLPLAIFGITLIVVMILAPGGLQALVSRVTRGPRGRLQSGVRPKAST